MPKWYIKNQFTQELYHILLGNAEKGGHESWLAMQVIYDYTDIVTNYAIGQFTKEQMIENLRRLNLPPLSFVEAIEEAELYKEQHERESKKL